MVSDVKVRPYEAGDDARWNAFVFGCPDATFFHRIEWRGIMEGVFRHRTHYLLAERDGQIVAVLPLVEVKSRLFGHAMTSLPFAVYGGIAGTDAEAVAALDQAVRSGKALYAGISSYSAGLTLKAQEIARSLGTPLVIHQPSYSILNRWVEEGSPSLLEAAAQAGMGVIGFSPLAQGMLTSRYLDGIPADSRAAQHKSLDTDLLKEENIAQLRELNKIAGARGQSLAQMAIAWALRDQGAASVTSVVLGASSVAQLDDNLDALGNLEFTADELKAIDTHSGVEGINLWKGATESVTA